MLSSLTSVVPLLPCLWIHVVDPVAKSFARRLIGSHAVYFVWQEVPGAFENLDVVNRFQSDDRSKDRDRGLRIMTRSYSRNATSSCASTDPWFSLARYPNTGL